MHDHIRTLGILYIVFGALTALVALIVGAVFALSGAAVGFAALTEDPDAAVAVPIIGVIGVILFLSILLLGIPGIIAGMGLLKYRPWARILTIVLSAFNLFHFPLGTALGVYGLWVLLNEETEKLFLRSGAIAPQTPA